MADKPAGDDKDKGPSQLGETIDLLKRYVLQETVGPLKGVGRAIGYGVGGALLLGVGLVILGVALLRVLQGETGRTFAGHWSWAPYLIVVVALVLAGAVTFARLTRSGRSRRGKAVAQ